MKALIAALQFLTAIPLGKPQAFDPRGIIVRFPLAGLVVGVLLAAFDATVSRLWSLQIASVLFMRHK